MSSFKGTLREMNDEIFELAFDESVCGFRTFKALAATSKLSPQTVSRLYYNKTREPRLSTLWKLSKAVGYKLELRK